MILFMLNMAVHLNNAQWHIQQDMETHFSVQTCVQSALVWKERLDPHSRYHGKISCVARHIDRK